jgi:rhodanese-related sulfurtransferase
MTTIKEITPVQLKHKIDSKTPFYLLDVREPNEVAICMIEGANHIPMNLVPLYLDKIPDEVDVVIYCHHGIRSLNVAHYLIENGFDNDFLYNLIGGIDAWARTIDIHMPKY